MWCGLLDARHFGLPMTRLRWFLIAIHATKDRGNFKWPDKITSSTRPSLLSFWDVHASQFVALHRGGKVWARNLQVARDVFCRNLLSFGDVLIMDMHASQILGCAKVDGLCPCLLRSKCEHGIYFMVMDAGTGLEVKRLDSRDMGKLMGWKIADIDKFLEVLTKKHLRAAFGKGMCIPVISVLLRELLSAQGIAVRTVQCV